MSDLQCLKCKKYSGDDWSQCEGVCPMEMSPHYKPEAAIKPSPTHSKFREQAEKLSNDLVNIEYPQDDVAMIESALKAAAAEARQAAIEEVKDIFLDYDYDEACERIDALSKEKQ